MKVPGSIQLRARNNTTYHKINALQSEDTGFLGISNAIYQTLFNYSTPAKRKQGSYNPLSKQLFETETGTPAYFSPTKAQRDTAFGENSPKQRNKGQAQLGSGLNLSNVGIEQQGLQIGTINTSDEFTIVSPKVSLDNTAQFQMETNNSNQSNLEAQSHPFTKQNPFQYDTSGHQSDEGPLNNQQQKRCDQMIVDTAPEQGKTQVLRSLSDPNRTDQVKMTQVKYSAPIQQREECTYDGQNEAVQGLTMQDINDKIKKSKFENQATFAYGDRPKQVSMQCLSVQRSQQLGQVPVQIQSSLHARQQTVSEYELDVLRNISSRDFRSFVEQEFKRLNFFMAQNKKFVYIKIVLPGIEYQLCQTKYLTELLNCTRIQDKTASNFYLTRQVVQLCTKLIVYSETIRKTLLDNQILDNLFQYFYQYTEVAVNNEQLGETFLVQDVLQFLCVFVEKSADAANQLISRQGLQVLLRLMRVKLHWIESDRVMRVIQALILAAPKSALKELLDNQIFADIAYIMQNVLQYEILRCNAAYTLPNGRTQKGAYFCYIPMELHEIVADIVLLFCKCKQNKYFSHGALVEQVYHYRVNQKFQQFVSCPSNIRSRVLKSIKADKALSTI